MAEIHEKDEEIHRRLKEINTRREEIYTEVVGLSEGEDAKALFKSWAEENEVR